MKRKIDRFYFELTTMCNLNCIHCFNYNGNYKFKFLELEKLKKFYKNIKGKTNGIVLTGGEPFLHPDIMHILEILKDEKVIITTNATLESPYYYGALLEKYPNVLLQISFDGMSKKVFEKVRGTGTYDKVKNVIEYLSACGYGQRVGLSMSILACNIGEVLQVVHFAEERQLHSVYFPTLILEGRCESEPDLLPNVESLNQVEDELLVLATENQELDISVNTLNRIAAWRQFGQTIDCIANATIKITVDGEIMPCPVAWKREESLGNIQDIDDFSQVINVLNEFCISKFENAQCSKCEGKDICAKQFCENCFIRKTNNSQGQQYRCENLRHHYNNILKEEKENIYVK